MRKKVALLMVTGLLLLSGCGSGSSSGGSDVKEYKLVRTPDSVMDDQVTSEFIFKMKDDKLIFLQEKLTYDMSLDPDIKIKAKREEEKGLVAEYEKTDKFEYRSEEKEDKVFHTELEYNLKDYPPEELLGDNMLNSEGKFDPDHVIKVLEKDGYVLK